MEFDGVISLGGWCQVSGNAWLYQLKAVNSPFDGFGFKTWQKIIELLENRFEDYWTPEHLSIAKKPDNFYSLKYITIHPIYKVYDNKYNVLSNHHFDLIDNQEDPLQTYPEFKEKMDILSEIFLLQCEQYERVLFVCKILSAPEPTTISQSDIRRLCAVLSKLRLGQPYELRISVPQSYFDQVVQWLHEDGLDHVKVYPWTIEWNDDNHTSEEWSWMFGNASLAPNHHYRLASEIMGITDPESNHIHYLNT